MNDLQDLLVGPGTQVPLGLSRKERKRLARQCRSRRYSANLVVDIGGTCVFQPSLQSGNGVSGQVCGLSGVVVGLSVVGYLLTQGAPWQHHP